MKRVEGLDIAKTPEEICPALKRKLEGVEEFGRNAHIDLGLRNENTNKQKLLQEEPNDHCPAITSPLTLFETAADRSGISPSKLGKLGQVV
jgi:hypothetical protein